MSAPSATSKRRPTVLKRRTGGLERLYARDLLVALGPWTVLAAAAASGDKLTLRLQRRLGPGERTVDRFWRCWRIALRNVSGP